LNQLGFGISGKTPGSEHPPMAELSGLSRILVFVLQVFGREFIIRDEFGLR